MKTRMTKGREEKRGKKREEKKRGICAFNLFRFSKYAGPYNCAENEGMKSGWTKSEHVGVSGQREDVKVAL